ncbi:MAG: zinc ribbon domain-containing protein [Candidatus Atribacteria bacterium]|nr:zinc ribbon domain-containing protein [Candidatus Atribacteria bacterium]
MPTYEYQCKKCSYVFEKFQAITDPPLRECPKCNGEVFRLISKNGSFILKGSGFYSTDNRRTNLPKEKLSSCNDKTAKKDSESSIDNAKPATEKTQKETAHV